MDPKVFAIGLGAIALWWWMTRDAEAAAAEAPEPDPIEPETEPVKPRPDADPQKPPNDGYHPLDVPKQGHWYATQAGDVLIRVVRRAGLPDRAWMALVRHHENQWIRQAEGQKWTTKGFLYPRYIPAYRGERHTKSIGETPVVYIPTESEARDMGYIK